MTQLVPFFVFLLAATTGGFFGYNQSNEPTFGAPTSNILRTILPETTDTYDLGSASKVWANLHVTQVCLSADCKTAWPTGGGGGSFPFSSDTNYAQVVYSTSTPTLWFKSGLFASSTSRFTALEALSATTTNFLTTNATSTNATTTNLSVSGGLTFNGVVGTTWAAFCTSITGGAGLCDGTDATGGGSGTVSTSTNETAGRLAYWTSNSGTPALLGEVATGTVSAGTGISLDSSVRSVVGGALQISNSGVISGSCSGGTTCSGTNPLTISSFSYPFTLETVSGQFGNSTSTLTRFFGGASTTAFSATTLAVGGSATTTINNAGAVTIPSGLTVSDLTSAILLTGSGGLLAEYAGTSCTNQFVRSLSALGVATCASINNGDWSGTDLSVANGGTGLSTFGGSNTILYTTAADSLSSEAAFTYTASTDNLVVVNASTTNISATNYLGAPYGSNPSIVGSATHSAIGVDSTVNELLYATTTNSTSPAVIKPYRTISFSYASSTQGSGTTTRSLAPADAAGYLDSIECHSNSFLRVVIYDASSNRINDLTASSTVGTVKLVSNNTFTASEGILVDIGTTTNVNSSVYLGCRAKYFYTRN